MTIFQLATVVHDVVTPFGPLMSRDIAESNRKNLAQLTGKVILLINSKTFNEGTI